MDLNILANFNVALQIKSFNNNSQKKKLKKITARDKLIHSILT